MKETKQTLFVFMYENSCLKTARRNNYDAHNFIDKVKQGDVINIVVSIAPIEKERYLLYNLIHLYGEAYPENICICHLIKDNSSKFEF